MSIQGKVHYLKTNSTTTEPKKVLAFHCSGGSPSQYHALGSLLGTGFQLDTPEYYGSRIKGNWSSERQFSLADEAAESIQKMDRDSCNSYHLVGHSYGGAIALRIALARPELVRSLTLYEPCVFNLLKYAGTRGLEALKEITSVADKVVNSLQRKDNKKAMNYFVDYWNGNGTWAALSKFQKKQLLLWAPKAALEFPALLNEKTALEAVDSLNVPTKVLYGEFTPFPTHIASLFLATMLGNAETQRINGLGHMGPLTHPMQVAQLTKEHIDECTKEPLDKKFPFSNKLQNSYMYKYRADLFFAHA